VGIVVPRGTPCSARGRTGAHRRAVPARSASQGIAIVSLHLVVYFHTATGKKELVGRK
jgi:hypothetical protein